MPSTISKSRERIFWTLAGLTVLGIIITLFLDRPVQILLVSPEVQFWLFLTGFLAAILAVILYGLRWRPRKIEIFIWMALLAILAFFLFRLGASERSHMLEYSLLAIFVLQALQERWAQKSKFYTIRIAFLITLAVGVADELIQCFLPYRVFDVEDILFNGLAALLSLSVAWFLSWMAMKFNKGNKRRF